MSRRVDGWMNLWMEYEWIVMDEWMDAVLIHKMVRRMYDGWVDG